MCYYETALSCARAWSIGRRRTSQWRRSSSSRPTGELFVGLAAEDIAEVGDGGAEFRRGEGIECDTGDGGCRFEASEAVEEHRESCQGAA
jgi:hypothetical protein